MTAPDPAWVACGFLCGAIVTLLVALGIAVLDVDLPDDWDRP